MRTSAGMSGTPHTKWTRAATYTTTAERTGWVRRQYSATGIAIEAAVPARRLTGWWAPSARAKEGRTKIAESTRTTTRSPTRGPPTAGVEGRGGVPGPTVCAEIGSAHV